MNETAKKAAVKFCKEYHVCSPDGKQVEEIIGQLGYTIVKYNAIVNDEDVDLLINKLNVYQQSRSLRGFTYVNEKYRIVFVDEDLSETEKRIVLTHELGHIYCGHFSHGDIIGQDVQDEYEANEFVHYVLTPTANMRMQYILWRKWKLIIPLVLLVGVLAAGMVYINRDKKEEQYYGEYYITESGKKYHKEDCMYIKDKSNIHRMTKEEFDSGEYEPCKVCLPK